MENRKSENPIIQKEIAVKVGLSTAETSESINRSMVATLLDVNGKLLKNNFYEFIIYGIKYVFPAIMKGVGRGIPTAYSAQPLNKMIVSNKNDKIVWVCSEGKHKGQIIEPLYPSVVNIVDNNIELYELLTLIDALRIGNTREYKIAIAEIKKRLL